MDTNTTFVAIGYTADAHPVTKRVDDRHLNGNFEKLVGYMIDSNPDEINSGYTQQEKMIASAIKSGYDMRNKKDDNGNSLFQVGYIPEGGTSPVDVTLDQIVKSQSGIFHTISNSFDDEAEFSEIKLVCEKFSQGGY